MKKLSFLVLFFLSFTVFADVPVTFFQATGKATLVKLHDTNYLLTFTNQPEYINFWIRGTQSRAGVVTLDKFLTLWSGAHPPINFLNKPPRATLALTNRRGEQQSALVLVTNPSFENGTISYQISAGKVTLFNDTLKHAVLVFDPVSINPDSLQ